MYPKARREGVSTESILDGLDRRARQQLFEPSEIEREAPPVGRRATAPSLARSTMTPISSRICLCMIVRDEAAVIERALDAAQPVIDAVSICDTGSRDRTIELIEAWLSRHAIAGDVHRHDFRDFAHNRTLAIAAARQTLASFGWNPAGVYLLFLDADMVLRIGSTFRKDDLHADAYRVTQRNGALEYPNVRLARASLDARFVGATHEYFSAPSGISEEFLDSLTIEDRNDGGSRSDKYARDRRLLEEELCREPGNVRAMFYLAQTCRGMGDLLRALFWYRRRVAAGGWREEAWCAQLAVGEILAEAGDVRDAVRALITAARMDPARPETFFHLAYLLRSLGRHRSALRCARAGLEIGYPRERALFVNREICDWGLLREVSINAFYTPFLDEGREANERLALGRMSPGGYASLATNNAIFYAEPLPQATYARIEPRLPDEFGPCNPSIVRTDDGYLINCRAVSYRLDAYQNYKALELDGILRTRNFLMRTDRELRFIDQHEVASEAEPLRQSRILGLEDARLFRHRGRTGFTCTTTNLHPGGYLRISLFGLNDDLEPGPHVPLAGYGDDLFQKNWLPFSDRQTGDLCALYGYEPLVVLRVDPESGRVSPVRVRRQGRRFEHFRGSAGPLDLPVEAGGGRLALVHEVAFHGLRYYMHRFLRIDEEWNVVEASAPFYFLRRGIEFVCGAALAHGDEDLLITFGVEDREAWLCRLPLRTAIGLLRPLPDWPRNASGVIGADDRT